MEHIEQATAAPGEVRNVKVCDHEFELRFGFNDGVDVSEETFLELVADAARRAWREEFGDPE